MNTGSLYHDPGARIPTFLLTIKAWGSRRRGWSSKDDSKTVGFLETGAAAAKFYGAWVRATLGVFLIV